MKILFIITKSEIGGAQKYVKEQIQVCAPVSQVYLMTNEPGWLVDEVKDLLQDCMLDKRIESRMAPGLLRSLNKFIRRHNIDLVVTNSANGGLYGRLAAAMTGIDAVYVSHGWSSVYNGGKLAFVLNRVERGLALLGSKVLNVSAADYKTAIEKIGIKKEKLALIHNCIFPINSKARSYQVGQRLQLLCLARFAPPKRMDLIRDAVKDLGLVDLHLFGDGPGFKAFQEDLLVNPIPHIFLHGEVRNFSAFDQYHAFVLISDSEGLPMSALEAMSVGMPLILSNVGGCPELVVNKDLLVDNTVYDIQRAVRLLQQDYAAYQLNMRPYFDTHFNLVLNKDKYIDLYSSIIKKLD